MTNYANLLKEYDLKVTPQRVAIVDELYMNGHMNIDELYKKLLDRFPSVSLATIYKNVNSMLEKTFLSEVKIPNAKSVYELVKTEHAHLVCKECGFIEDIMLDSSDIIEQVSKINNFKIDSTDIVLSGTCKKCCK
ncbi:peroxide stress transcriptional regulator PerR [Aliarcobacter faecis]|uniref:Fur family transcriptional regulator n=1 Tax=Aliarcobacter faecis TaxID=1564138 RepID=UPI00047EA0C3|nr:Fur family transcriptional regulator [Aliarcobacter faecis]QKF73589.1 peroxide stress transcriptional regulator PerR [Aliarcobacter faecis]